MNVQGSKFAVACLLAVAAGCVTRPPPAPVVIAWRATPAISFNAEDVDGSATLAGDPGLAWSTEGGRGRLSGVTGDEDWPGNGLAVVVTNDTRALVELSVDFRAAEPADYLLVSLRGNRNFDGRNAPLCLSYEWYDGLGQYKPTTRWLGTSATLLEGDLSIPGFNDETTVFHNLRIVLDRMTAQLAYYVDEQRVALLQLGAAIDPIVSLQVDVATPYKGRKVDVEWANLQIRTAGPPL